MFKIRNSNIEIRNGSILLTILSLSKDNTKIQIFQVLSVLVIRIMLQFYIQNREPFL